MKLEVGNFYTAKDGYQYECIATTDEFAWLKATETTTAYVWTIDGKSVSLSSEYDIINPPREYWIGRVSMIAYTYYVPNCTHVREVMPE